MDEPLRRFRCTVCNYVYDPEQGDPDGGVAPGTSFEDIPDTWACPQCQVDKTQFKQAKEHKKKKHSK